MECVSNQQILERDLERSYGGHCHMIVRSGCGRDPRSVSTLEVGEESHISTRSHSYSWLGRQDTIPANHSVHQGNAVSIWG
eukprot:5035256-Amphidinium_carterae.2